MTEASGNGHSIIVSFALHDVGVRPVEVTRFEDSADALEREINALLDGALPPDGNNPLVVAARREQLTDAARHTAGLVIELLVHSHLTTARGMNPTAEDLPVVAAAQSITALHQAMCFYRRNTGHSDALEMVKSAMTTEEGLGVADVAVELLQRLWDDLNEMAQESHKTHKT